MISKDKIQEFIDNGNVIKTTEYHDTSLNGGFIPSYISGPSYDQWMNNIKLFTERYLIDYPLYSDIIDCYNSRNSDIGTTSFDRMMSYLNSIHSDDEFFSTTQSHSLSTLPRKEKKLFISHSSQDIEFIKPFVLLLDRIGFAGRGLIFCSSISGYDIPLGKKIYDYLKDEFDHEVILISFLSNNYYSSAASLNEMGAAWIKSAKQHAILLPWFEYSQISGAIDASKIWMKLNDKHRLNELKNILLNEFELPRLSETQWENSRDDFLKEIDLLIEKYKYNNYLQKLDLEGLIEEDDRTIRCVFRLKNDSSTPISCTKIELELYDFNDVYSSLNITYSDMKEYIIYGKEHRRVVIHISKDRFSNYNTFDFNSLKHWNIKSSWSTAAF